MVTSGRTGHTGPPREEFVASIQAHGILVPLRITLSLGAILCAVDGLKELARHLRCPSLDSLVQGSRHCWGVRVGWWLPR